MRFGVQGQLLVTRHHTVLPSNFKRRNFSVISNNTSPQSLHYWIGLNKQDQNGYSWSHGDGSSTPVGT